MTKKEFHFEEIGQQTPFRVPEGFFERMQEEVLAQTVQKKRTPMRVWKRTVAAVLAAAAILTGAVWIFPVGQQAEKSTSGTLVVAADDASYADIMDNYVKCLSDEELAEWIEFSENDIFMNFN